MNRVTINLSQVTLERFHKKRTQLYEQKASPDRLGAYTKRFEQWAKAGIEGAVEVVIPTFINDALNPASP